MDAAPIESPHRLLQEWTELPPVSLDDMLGQWRGAELATGHPMNGLLDAAGWYGKAFVDVETVHPLLFWNARRTGLFAVHPARLPMGLPIPRGAWLRAGLLLARPWLGTRRPTARLRLVEMRGTVSAAMIYDHRPIVDGFRRLDDDRVLGLMDRRGDPEPLFFTLERERMDVDGA